ncbi:MAG: hypothetical protein WBQ34_07050 [Candidatus Acidiferrales bacterium]
MKQTANASKAPIASIATRTACALCAASKDFQNDLLKHLTPSECHRFCNGHGWMVANSTPAISAAVIFLGAIANPDWGPASPLAEDCDICRRMHDEKERRLIEIADQFRSLKGHSWLHDNGMLCLRHSRELISKVPEVLRESVQELLARNGGEIVALLEDYLERAKVGAHAGGGVLGRAAEFLVAQRGIEA